ncbi:GNAT family N-acetyltransferase [Rhodohalobacter halophilus]|uniref:GNAT family N-acetyltransferase n=1 Tax=Rhodohalobacter halophilus TaxID=1812810 RepID=UPI0009FBAF3B|nr:hypothetical protein [Rhodohalobacter halophilus]
MNIRTAIAADLPAIDIIYNEAIEEGFRTAHTEPMGKDARLNWFKNFNEKYPLYVSEEESEVTGWLSISPYRKGRQALSETAEVSFYVSRNARGAGGRFCTFKPRNHSGRSAELSCIYCHTDRNQPGEHSTLRETSI